MAQGQSESTKARLLANCIITTNARNIASRIKNNSCGCSKLSAPPTQLPTALSEHDYTLQKAIRCPILYYNAFATYGCQPIYTPEVPYLEEPGTEPPQGPGVTNVYRQFARIANLDQISKPLVGRSGDDRTARLRAGIEASAATRYSQTVLPVVPYPPCIPRGPQPGVPVAPNSGCNLGNRRVDYSNPNAS